MIRNIKYSLCLESPWKNGLGTTKQIVISPPESSIQQNNFDWRLSLAQIDGENQFSLFPDYDRLLIVWDGPGLILNDLTLLPHSPHFFSGDLLVHCRLLMTKVLDLGLIFKRNHYIAELEVLKISPRKVSTPQRVSLNSSLHFFFLASGNQASCGEFQLDRGDILIVEDEDNVIISTSEELLLYKISLTKK
jgi:environmental stress-induced protein Ves